ncbi:MULTISPECIES: efflux RND transporter permease subunit [unclassified Okeania]|uniref:efflux RND transporter permease subunit n=1 Tax=unclassified Okeania TaxID=2634635 RepID=UPI0013B6A7B7|nr:MULTISPECIES: efflux RND transporter permease subunit [unclassified Okeania]NES77472.1 efflux RND transporter permease subunit [Okeania sp. SIO1H4]NET21152.1 efflux RND transporter permease subunit [Okeania sp. SIO1H5]NET94245.1 efflux RND transporter permease subunit [Okeania sp. SIO1H2]
MSFHLSAWSIKKPVPTLVMFLVLTVVGLMSFLQLGIDNLPNVDIPLVSVTVTQQGAGPTELETQVTKKIEDAVASLGDIDKLTSRVTDGVSNTTITFDVGVDSDRATNDVRNAIDQIRQDLPRDVDDPIVQRLDFAGGGAIMAYAVTSNKRSVEELSELVDKEISRAILNVTGVSQINRIGGVDREILIELSPERLESLGITATQVNEQIRALNANIPGGRSQAGGREKSIRTLGSADTVEALKEYQIILPSGGAVPLSSVGQVIDGFGETRETAWLLEKNSSNQDSEINNIGKPVVAFGVLRSTGSTLVTVEKNVRKAVAQLRKTLPPDVNLQLIFTKATEIEASYQASIDALVIGSILTVVVVGIFLRDWRPTLVTAVALPLSILPTFLVIKTLNYTLDQMTLLALALAMGNLVDDAICMIENIEQHISKGKKPFQAALDGSAEIGFAVVATTATIVAVFLPVAFMGGVPGQFFKPFGITVAVATMFSTLVATTMTPMLGARLLKLKRLETSPDFSEKNHKQRKIRPYSQLLTWALRHKILTLVIAIVFFIGSLQLVPLLPKGLTGGEEKGVSIVELELPPGSTLAETEQVAQQTIQLFQENPLVTSVFADLGSRSGGVVYKGNLYVTILPRQERNISEKEFEQQIRPLFQNIPGARIHFASQGPGGGDKDLKIILKSENAVALEQTSDALERQMRETPGLVDVTSSASLVKPEILIKPLPARAGDLGVSVQAIARTASLATLGDNETNLAKFDLADRQIPIRVQLAEEFRNDLDAIKNLRIPSQNGGLVPLSAVAEITIGSGPAEINRFNRYRQVSFEANLQGISLGDALTAVKSLPAMNPLPPDVTEESDGEAKIMMDIFSGFLGALGLAILCIYAILVLLYNNFLYPIVILVALPLSIGGALLGLMIFQKELGLFALIGIVLLMGLVTKNAILLVDCSLANEKAGMPQFHAVREAGISRLRPILMTTLSTIAGMLPIALELGAGGAERSPMAIAVIGGFTTSTLLTLVVVPVWFTYIDNFLHWLKKLLGRSTQMGVS